MDQVATDAEEDDGVDELREACGNLFSLRKPECSSMQKAQISQRAVLGLTAMHDAREG